MSEQKTKVESPSHVPGTNRGEAWVRHTKEAGRETQISTARSSTGINAHKRGPIDPRMAHLPPA